MHRPEQKAIRTLAEATHVQEQREEAHSYQRPRCRYTPISCDVMSLLSAYMENGFQDVWRISRTEKLSIFTRPPIFSESEAKLFNIHHQTKHVSIFTRATELGYASKRPMKRPQVGHLRPCQVCYTFINVKLIIGKHGA